jgi:hypothetical protein
MSGIDEFIERAEAQPTVHQHRPSDPEPLTTIVERLVTLTGSTEDTIVLVEDEADYPLTTAWLKTDPSNVRDLGAER